MFTKIADVVMSKIPFVSVIICRKKNISSVLDSVRRNSQRCSQISLTNSVNRNRSVMKENLKSQNDTLMHEAYGSRDPTF
jgi:hypothetical protein